MQRCFFGGVFYIRQNIYMLERLYLNNNKAVPTSLCKRFINDNYVKFGIVKSKRVVIQRYNLMSNCRISKSIIEDYGVTYDYEKEKQKNTPRLTRLIFKIWL